MDRVLGLNDLLARLELRTAETPVASTVHHPFGSPSGPGLFHVKGLQLPAYIQNVAHALHRQGLPESAAIHRAVGIVENWKDGHDGHGNKVHPDVQAAAAKAWAEWEAAKAAAHGKRFNPYHLPVGPGGGEFTGAGGGGGGKAAHAKAARQPQDAQHQQAVQRPQGPVRQPRGVAGKTRAQHKTELLQQAEADRRKAHELEQQVDLLKKQAVQHAKAAKVAAAKAAAAKKAGHIAPHAKHATPGHTHAHAAKKHVTAAKTLAQKIADLRRDIRQLLEKAASLEAQARRL